MSAALERERIAALHSARYSVVIMEHAQLAVRQEHLANLINNVPGIVWETSLDPAAVFVSPYFERVTGYPCEVWLADPDFWRRIVHPSDTLRFTAELEAILDHGTEDMLAFRWIAADGRVLWIEAHVTVVRDDTGRTRCIRGVAMDVTRHRTFEESLRERIAELGAMSTALERKNQELDQFTYVTSHDLKVPLRGISNLTSRIVEDFGANVPEQIAADLALLRKRTDRLQAMIDGILEYSRVDRVSFRVETIDVRLLIDDIVRSTSIPAGFRTIIEEEMPRIKTERVRLDRVFRNLIDNAVQHHGRPAGFISIGSRDLGDEIEFRVADDGPGIAPEYHDKVFQMFQTLQPSDRTGNTGIGLTIAKKIVEHHGGEIAIESDGIRGTTVKFTWPKPRAGAG